MTFKEAKSAQNAIRKLNNFRLLSKSLHVKIATSNSNGSNLTNSRKRTLNTSVLQAGSDLKSECKMSKLDQIQALEAKLKSMQNTEEPKFKLAIPKSN